MISFKEVIKIIKLISIFSIIFTLAICIPKTHAINYETFYDAFDDANPDGWVKMGNWYIENFDLAHLGVFTHSEDGNISKALVEELILSDQIIETDLYLRDINSVAGIILWFKDLDNFVEITIDPISNAINVDENISGEKIKTIYPYDIDMKTWYLLKVAAKSDTGTLDFYVNNTYIFNHSVSTDNRLGSTGVHNNIGNAYFDNFSIITNIMLDDKNMCKSYEWQKFFSPIFKNQGQCILYALSESTQQ